MKNDTARKLVTLEDVARRAGVAKSTASAALSSKTGKYAVVGAKREIVLQAARELGFEANPHAQRLSQGRDNNTIGLFILDISTGVGVQKMRRVQSLLVEAGYDVPIYSSGGYDVGNDDSHCRLISTLRRQKPLAIICASPLDAQSLAELERFQSEGGVVACYDHASPLECDQIVLDREDNTYQAARHLLELGHRELGLYIDGTAKVEDTTRFRGFERALREFGGRTEATWLANSGNFQSGALNEGGGVLLAQRFLSWPRKPSALCVVNDASAVAFIATIERAGFRVPRDVSVVGHDDLPIAAVFPIPLTSVSHPVAAIAQGVVEMLLSRLGERRHEPPLRQTLRGELVVRGSTSPLNPNFSGEKYELR